MTEIKERELWFREEELSGNVDAKQKLSDVSLLFLVILFIQIYL